MTRLEVPVPCDLAESSFWRAFDQIFNAEGAIDTFTLRVHPYAKHYAQHVLWRSGLHATAVVVDESFDEDEWLLSSENAEVHSPGA